MRRAKMSDLSLSLLLLTILGSFFCRTRLVLHLCLFAVLLVDFVSLLAFRGTVVYSFAAPIKHQVLLLSTEVASLQQPIWINQW